MLQFRGSLSAPRPHVEVDRTILCGDRLVTSGSPYTSRKFRGDDSERVAFVLDNFPVPPSQLKVLVTVF